MAASSTRGKSDPKPTNPSPSLPSSLSLPKLFFIKQSTPKEEKFIRNGVVHFANVVVKNSPFTFQVGLSGLLNFHLVKLQTKLIYDQSPTSLQSDAEGTGDESMEGKEVDFVKRKPLECKLNIPPSGEYAYLELRIQVLSSQHEDSYFRVKVVALDPTTEKDFNPPLTVISNPIKTISKPEPEKLKRKGCGSGPGISDLLLETVRRLEMQQEEQQTKITQLFDLLLGQHQLQQFQAQRQSQQQASTQPPTQPPAQPVAQPPLASPQQMSPLKQPTSLPSVVVSSPPVSSPPVSSPLPSSPLSSPMTPPASLSLSSLSLPTLTKQPSSPLPSSPLPSFPSSISMSAVKLSTSCSVSLDYDSFDEAFQLFLSQFKCLPQEERANKIRKLAKTHSREMTELYFAMAEGLGNQSSENFCAQILAMEDLNFGLA